MERCKTGVVLSQDHVILTDDSRTLWCNRRTGTLTAGNEFHRDATLEYLDLGKVWGIVGKICFFPEGEWKLAVITQASYVGELPHGGDVYCVDRIGIIPLTGGSTETIGLEPEAGLDSSLTARPQSPVKTKETREREKVEKRLTDALLNMFNDSQSFYFCLNSDLTQSLQRRLDSPEEHQQLPLWERMDKQFFWNKWMLSDLLDRKLNDLKLSTSWVLPLIQGYVELRQIPVLSEDTPTILRPGWSAQYREERERILRECEEEQRGRGLQRRGEEGPRQEEEDMEIEMKDMADVGRGESMIPMQTFRPISGTGYESDGEASASDEEREETEVADFSPVKFTSAAAAAMAAGSSGDVRVIPAIKGTGVGKGSGGAAGWEGEAGGDATGGSAGAGEEGGGDAGAKGDGCAADQSVLGSSQVCTTINSAPGELAELTPCQPISEDSGSTLQQDSESTLCISAAGHTGQGGEATHVPRPAGSSGGNETGTMPSLAASVEETDKVNDMLSSSTFYRSEEVSDSEMEGTVLIDIVKSSETSSSYSSPEKKTATTSEDTQEGSQDALYEFPSDLEAVSPMGNPFLESKHQEKKAVHTPSFTLAIISRRSCHRAGTRYKRRGVDSEGHVANYVETELVLRCGSHVVSYVIIRGSVPVYWSQPGNKYRPLPIIERSVEETQQAFRKHFDMHLGLFKEMVAVNLVKQTGREKLVGDAFEQHVLLMDDPFLSYVAFDFHQSYKENQTLALQKLLDGTTEFIKRFKFCWIDTAQSYGPLCKQEGVFRVNCMDCLDRTNVVESLLSREVLQTSLQKLGMIPFDETLGGATLVSYQEMWANNGDVISKQYAGTAAMKGDITRYGERKFTGLMKDGYNSAHRYYLNVFRDSYRQVLIDLMQGVSPSEAFSSLSRFMQAIEDLDEGLLQPEPPPVDKSWTLERESAMVEMINVCKDELFPRLSEAPLSTNGLYGWVLMEAAGYSFLGDSKEEEPCVVMHSAADAQLCVAKFNIESRKILCFLRVPTSQIQKIVIGPLGIIIRNSKRLHMRVHYSLSHDTSYYFTFTTANCISTAEDRAILVSIAELLARLQPSIIVQEQKISKKKSLPHKGVIYLVLPESNTSFPDSSSGPAVDTCTSRDLDCSLKSEEKPFLNIDGRGSGEEPKKGEDEEEEEQEEEEEEPSASAPSSPKLKSPLRQRWHHSCDDLLSTSTITIPSPADPSQPQEAQPSITVTTPSTRHDALVVPALYELDDSDTSCSDLDLSDSEGESRLPTNLGTSNTLKDVLKTPPGAETDYAGDDEDDSELKETADESRRGSSSGASGGKFSRLKGRFLRTVKHSTNTLLSRPRSRSPQPQDPPSSSGEGAATLQGRRRRSLSPAQVEGESSKGPPASQLQQVASTMKNRFKMNSPHLWRKARKTSPGAPSEEEVSRAQAQLNCKSKIIYIT